MSMTANINNYIPGFRKTAGLVKREILDQKTGFVTVPLVVAGLIALATVGNIFFSVEHFIGIASVHELSGFVDDEGRFLQDILDSVDDDVITTIIGGAALALATPLLMIMPFVMINAILSTLFDDRKDRSYLFFKSMPVSDTHEVSTKLATILLGVPLITFAIAFALQIVVSLALSLYLLPTDLPVGALWTHMPIVAVWGPVFITMITYFLWAMPFIGWGIAVSAYAPKAPLMVAVVPLVAVSILEQVLFKSEYFAKWLLSYAGVHFGKTAVSVKEGSVGMVINELDDAKINMLSASDAFEILGKSLMQADFWIGIAIGVALIAAAIRGRKYNV